MIPGIADSNKALMKEVVAQIKAVYQCVNGDPYFYLGLKGARDRIEWAIAI